MSQYNIKEIRLNKGFTQLQVAEATELSKDYISMIERGERNPSDKVKEKLSEFYGVSVVQIFLAIQRTKCSTNNKN